MKNNNHEEKKMETEELLNRARMEIIELRKAKERLSIRVTAIDDMLSLLHGKPGAKTEGVMSPDIVWEIERALSNEINPTP